MSPDRRRKYIPLRFIIIAAILVCSSILFLKPFARTSPNAFTTRSRLPWSQLLPYQKSGNRTKDLLIAIKMLGEDDRDVSFLRDLQIFTHIHGSCIFRRQDESLQESEDDYLAGPAKWIQEEEERIIGKPKPGTPCFPLG